MNEIVTTDAKTPETQFLEVIERIATNPDVDVSKLSAILDMQERILAKRWESEFNEAFTCLAAEMPRITKKNEVEIKGVVQYKFASWDNIDATIRPIMSKHGFSLSFDTVQRVGEGGGIIVTGTLLHRSGHKRTASIPVALEASGSKNNVQGMGSSLSYGKRYVTTMLLNLTTVGEDDDGVQAGIAYITAAQIAEIDALVAKLDDPAPFFRWAGITNTSEMQATNFLTAKNKLANRIKSMEVAK
jgi:hypothetical protein